MHEQDAQASASHAVKTTDSSARLLVSIAQMSLEPWPRSTCTHLRTVAGLHWMSANSLQLSSIAQATDATAPTFLIWSGLCTSLPAITPPISRMR